MALGVAQVRVVVNFCAVVLCAAEAAAYWLSAAQVALILHVPVPEVMVTVVPLTEQGPLAVMTAAALALVVAVMVKADLKGAVVGAPVNEMVGVAFIAGVVSIIVGAV